MRVGSTTGNLTNLAGEVEEGGADKAGAPQGQREAMGADLSLHREGSEVESGQTPLVSRFTALVEVLPFSHQILKIKFSYILIFKSFSKISGTSKDLQHHCRSSKKTLPELLGSELQISHHRSVL